MCNCEYCIECKCGHRADVHIAGDGQCFICNCTRFTNRIAEHWDRMTDKERSEYQSFSDFVDNYDGE